MILVTHVRHALRGQPSTAAHDSVVALTTQALLSAPSLVLASALLVAVLGGSGSQNGVDAVSSLAYEWSLLEALLPLLSTLVAAAVLRLARLTWPVGALLLASYLALAVTFFYHP